MQVCEGNQTHRRDARCGVSAESKPDYCNSIKFVLDIFIDRVEDGGLVHLSAGDWLPVEVIIKLEKQAARRGCLYVRLCSINLRYGKVRAIPGLVWEHDQTSFCLVCPKSHGLCMRTVR